SAPVKTTATPSIAAAALESIDLILACACGERSTCSHSAPSSGLSSMKCPLPVISRWSSRRLGDLPAPKRRLPGRMFISGCSEFLGLWSGDMPKRASARLALVRRQRGLWRHGIADVISLERKPRLDACREIEARESLVDAPEFSLQHHRLVPPLRLAEIVE